MTLINVKNAPGRTLSDPANQMRPIASSDDPVGTPVEDNSYWRRRIADGDAIIVGPASGPEPAPAPAKAPAEPISEPVLGGNK